MDHPFRSAMFGGFNRQDVLEYLENSAQQAAQQQQELQAPTGPGPSRTD